MADVLLQVHNGSKAFGSRTLFEKASFAVNEGEHIGVIGPNGAGKTTLFRCLTLQDQLDKGQIIRSHSLRLGYLAQEEFFEPDLCLTILGKPVKASLGSQETRPKWGSPKPTLLSHC
ncbi:MAG: ABC-F family ATP-binding cassette domain-containing protein [Bdellovibrionales bacterium]|nr:ABC-F family ATP-binding cassette domain-containing protein [Bdellovibrionales bacterium]